MRFAAVSGLSITVISATLIPANSHADTVKIPPPGHLTSHPSASKAINCEKNWVSDGDTVNAFCEGKKTRIRLYCIDAPETSQGQWGNTSSRQLQKIMNNRFKLIIQDTDRYGRAVGEIFNADGKNLNLAMVGSGAASVYKSYCNKKDNEHYYSVEAFAKENKYGIWSSNDPLIKAPWEYRKLERSEKKENNTKMLNW